MNRKCQICGKEYDSQLSTSFFFVKYCSEECEKKAEIEARSEATGVHMYMCILPLQINIWDGKDSGKTSTIEEGTKWRRDYTKSNGLHTIHLVSASGRLDEEIDWLEISEQALKEHFQKI